MRKPAARAHYGPSSRISPFAAPRLHNPASVNLGNLAGCISTCALGAPIREIIHWLHVQATTSRQTVTRNSLRNLAGRTAADQLLDACNSVMRVLSRLRTWLEVTHLRPEARCAATTVFKTAKLSRILATTNHRNPLQLPHQCRLLALVPNCSTWHFLNLRDKDVDLVSIIESISVST
ncbi:hypothetical protein BDU57DRAFT_341421 [Ampelomyces quisqualis]|uniref:Uncharacterized protein n=1 Tax=Ampelomyces quisqualis TaxID=50730 RepID=A0A6A5QC62_AMPQU|nr:hypothetical protein BDU57DRAFT_341421 [Ampelomyces quisqualis]